MEKAHRDMNPEKLRLEQDRLRQQNWRQWGPYLSERQWGTVREDYSSNGDAWNYLSHDDARGKAYRWGEDGLAGICDENQHLCLALALWNGVDPFLKERLFGLTNSQGNHGEDVKELYYYLDATPTHSYLKMLYKYPQRPFPYAELIERNAARGKADPEFELLDTGIFDDDRYFDVFVEYAKAGPTDILCQVTVHNRGPEPAALHVIPQLWFRNTWSWTGAGGQARADRGRKRCHRGPACEARGVLSVQRRRAPAAVLRQRDQCRPALWPGRRARLLQGRVSRRHRARQPRCHQSPAAGHAAPPWIMP